MPVKKQAKGNPTCIPNSAPARTFYKLKTQL